MRNLSSVNVCFLAGTLGHGGAERQLFYILQALCRAGRPPRLLSLDCGKFWEDRIKALGVPITWVGHQRSRLKRLFRIVKELRADPPDVMQSAHFYANAYVSMAAGLLRAAGIGAMRSNGQIEVSGSGPVGGWLNLHLPRTLAANSKRGMQYARARGVAAERLYFLPNVVDTDHFKPSGRRFDQPLTVVAVGRLVKEKRLDRFISMLSQLRSNFRLNVRGFIVGPGSPTGDLRPDLENHARSLGLFPGAIEFLGAVSDIASVYREADICALTSDCEGTPNALLEAMACGLPVVATDVGGVAEIVQNGRTGFVVEREDMDGLVGALAKLVQHAKLRIEMGRHARAFVEERHSLQRLAGYLDSLYNLALPAMHRHPAPVAEGSLI